MSMVRNMSIYLSERAVFGGKSVRHRERKRQKGDVDETRKTGGEIGRKKYVGKRKEGKKVKYSLLSNFKKCKIDYNC